MDAGAVIDPLAGESSPEMRRSKVDLPVPLRPTSPVRPAPNVTVRSLKRPRFERVCQLRLAIETDVMGELAAMETKVVFSLRVRDPCLLSPLFWLQCSQWQKGLQCFGLSRPWRIRIELALRPASRPLSIVPMHHGACRSALMKPRCSKVERGECPQRARHSTQKNITGDEQLAA